MNETSCPDTCTGTGEVSNSSPASNSKEEKKNFHGCSCQPVYETSDDITRDKILADINKLPVQKNVMVKCGIGCVCGVKMGPYWKELRVVVMEDIINGIWFYVYNYKPEQTYEAHVLIQNNKNEIEYLLRDKLEETEFTTEDISHLNKGTMLSSKLCRMPIPFSALKRHSEDYRDLFVRIVCSDSETVDVCILCEEAHAPKVKFHAYFHETVGLGFVKPSAILTTEGLCVYKGRAYKVDVSKIKFDRKRQLFPGVYFFESYEIPPELSGQIGIGIQND